MPRKKGTGSEPVPFTLVNAVRAARSYDTSVPRRYCFVERCKDGDRWHVTVVTTTTRVLDPIELNFACDRMRRLLPAEWDEAYASAERSAQEQHKRRRLEHDVVLNARGVEFWRAYYGVPNAPIADLLAAHDRARRAHWDPKRVVASDLVQREKRAYRRHVRAIVLRAVDIIERELDDAGFAFDAELVRSAFRLVRESDRAVLVARDDSPLLGAMYPTHALPRHMLPDSENARGPRRNATKNGVLDNARVLVVREISSGPELEALLAHELAHAITLPVWQTDNNHPPAFTEFETVTASALISARKRSAPSPPRSEPRRASSSRRAGTRRSP